MISTEGGLGPPDSSACMGNEDASFARKAFAEWLVGGIGPPQEKVAFFKTKLLQEQSEEFDDAVFPLNSVSS